MNWFSRMFTKSTSRASDIPDPALTNHSDQHGAIIADNPLRETVDDRLGRAAAAESFALNVLHLDASEGLVVAVLGAWGSGKTSFINFSRSRFKEDSVAVLDFNPWMFSGAEQLVQSFFSELSAQLKMRPGLAEVGKGIEEYGEIFSNLTWVPLVGPWIERGQDFAKLVAELLQRKKDGVGSQRTKVEKALRSLKKPIVVVLDDIDRLNTAEIRDIFRLVRLTANFPNIIYILAFDRKRVENALTEEGIPGRAYLEKILQLGFDLPAIPDHVLNQQIFHAIDGALNGIPNPGHLDSTLWPDVFSEVIRPLISNMRDVRRYAAAISGTVRSLNGQIALADVLALEAIRVFLPDVFERLPSAVAALTTSNHGYGENQEQIRLKQEVDELLAVSGSKVNVMRALIQRLFMAAQRHIGGMHYGGDWSRGWLREHRVAHSDIFRLYLERVAGQGLIAFNYAERAWELMHVSESFDEYLRAINPEQVIDVIASLEAYENEVNPERVAPGITTLLNLIPSLPEQQRGMFSIGTAMVVSRVVYRLIRSQNSEAFVETTVRTALPQLHTFFARLTLIEMVGHREGVGHKLLPEAVATELQQAWRVALMSADVDVLANEPELLRSLLVLRQGATTEEPPFVIPPDARITHSMLLSGYSEALSQSMGNRAVTRSPRLAWKILADLYGDEDVLRGRIEELKASSQAINQDLLQLAEKYLSGWRPKEFGEN